MSIIDNFKELKIGDVVRLKSGSPDMTVLYIKEIPKDKSRFSIGCCWFNFAKDFPDKILLQDGINRFSYHQIGYDDFDSEMLVKVK